MGLQVGRADPRPGGGGRHRHVRHPAGAASMGAFVATTASPSADKALVDQAGARTWSSTTAPWTSGRCSHGYDCLYDVFGGKSLDEGFKILRRGGRVVSLNGTPNARFGRAQHLGFLEDRRPCASASLPLTLREKRYGVTYDMIFVRPDSPPAGRPGAGSTRKAASCPSMDKVFPARRGAAGARLLAVGPGQGQDRPQGVRGGLTSGLMRRARATAANPKATPRSAPAATSVG